MTKRSQKDDRRARHTFWAWSLRVLRKDAQHRAFALSLPGSVLNCGYAGFNLVAGLAGRSAWLISLGVYYLMLTLMRLGLLAQEFLGQQSRKPDSPTQWRAFRRCGILIMIASAALCGMTILIAVEGRGYRYSQMLTYAVATYTFVKAGLAIASVTRAVRMRSAMLMTLRNIALADAAVSMLALQTAMFTAFGAGTDATLRTVMNIATGACVCALVVVMGLSMTIVGGRQLRRMDESAES